ncbi:hypothetical protein SAMN05216266_103168 [Amycolatopsis marina]|uniref:Mce-associated membrane protein n=1 Tax=Amycolatopsis marina TaxID=490629 RepID=A0A1I0XFP8_9PSEU|nr:hypothetical protein [Amycolatopsis marina]SFA99744.1 hypothetical protein SAMN05216266_103168 [Amycolatopsis marina]
MTADGNGRASRWIALGVTALVLASAGSSVLLLRTPENVPGLATPDPAMVPVNLALLDSEGTAAVLSAAEAAVEAVFTYSSRDLDAHKDEVIAAHVTENAAKEVGQQLDRTARKAGGADITVTSTIEAAGVSELGADHARVLTFIAQDSTRVDTGARSTGLARALLNLVREDETWLVDEFDTDLAVTAIDLDVESHPQAKDRDALLAAAQTAGATLASLDASDPEGTMDRSEAVAVDPLRTQIREARDANIDKLVAAGTVAVPAAPAAVAAVEFDRAAGTATVLLALEINVTQHGEQRGQRPTSMRLGVTRTERGWLASSVDLIRPTA